MGNDKRLGFAFAASLLVNTACVAMVGTAALRHPRPPHHDITELHPAPMHMADASQVHPLGSATGDKSGDGASDGDAGDGKPGSSPASGAGLGQGKVDASKPASPAEAARDRQSAAAEQQRLEERLKSGLPLSARQKAWMAHRMLALAALHSPPNPNSQEQGAQAARDEQRAAQNASPAASSHQAGSPKPGSPEASKPGLGSQDGHAHSRMTVITRALTPGKGGRIGDRGDSVSPKMVHYPKAKLDLGTVHMTRPTHGVTGGGSSDLRNVDIKVHYVVDDPNNVPKNLAPNKVLHKFPSNCNGDPGNTSKCLPTGGNTSLGGTTLHGTHDQITGVKYCVPGGGGIPGAGQGGSQGAAQNSRGHEKGAARQTGPDRIISEVYHGRGQASAAPLGTGQAGLALHPGERVASVINPSHLPATHGDFQGLVPGAKAPEADRKWVENPEAHTDSAAPGVRTPPMPRFTLAPRSIGSLSRFGTLNWGRTVKTRPKKAPYGGDGTGLLGLYYHGNSFNQLAFTRPDRNIDFDWSGGPPDPRIAPGTEYSVRWLGEIAPKVSDTYTLMLSSDDGARLYLGGRLVIANWTVHSPSEDTVTVYLEAGRRYALKLEYYENAAPPAVMKMYWEAPSVPREYVPESCLYYPKVHISQ